MPNSKCDPGSIPSLEGTGVMFVSTLSVTTGIDHVTTAESWALSANTSSLLGQLVKTGGSTSEKQYHCYQQQ